MKNHNPSKNSNRRFELKESSLSSTVAPQYLNCSFKLRLIGPNALPINELHPFVGNWLVEPPIVGSSNSPIVASPSRGSLLRLVA